MSRKIYTTFYHTFLGFLSHTGWKSGFQSVTYRALFTKENYLFTDIDMFYFFNFQTALLSQVLGLQAEISNSVKPLPPLLGPTLSSPSPAPGYLSTFKLNNDLVVPISPISIIYYTYY